MKSNIKEMPLSDLKPLEDNIRTHPRKQIEEFKKSIEQLGQFRPIIVDEENTILAGNGLYFSLKELGKEKALVDKRLGYTNAQKKKLIIADNRLFELGMSNQDNLMKIFEDLAKEKDFLIPGYDEELIKDLLSTDKEIDEQINSYGAIEETFVDELEENSFETRPNPNDMQVENSTKQKEIELNNENIKLDKGKPIMYCPHCNGKIEL